MIKALVTDIEGTTSSIDFVHEVLFPYAAERLPDFVRRNLDDERVVEALSHTALRSGLPAEDSESLIQQLLRWMAEDKKITPLKTLQGLIWEEGYHRAHYRAHIYQDAAVKLREWHDKGLPLYVYSSGSIHAQKLFFRFSEAGNLLPLFSGHFDTTTGAKRDPTSYRKIAEALQLNANEIMFLSDVVEELDAAVQAGMRTVWIQRGSAPLQYKPPHQSARAFTELVFQ